MKEKEISLEQIEFEQMAFYFAHTYKKKILEEINTINPTVEKLIEDTLNTVAKLAFIRGQRSMKRAIECRDAKITLQVMKEAMLPEQTDE